VKRICPRGFLLMLFIYNENSLILLTP
jgi:hypothetical protein